jgi:hypothetical protein
LLSDGKDGNASAQADSNLEVFGVLFTTVGFGTVIWV